MIKIMINDNLFRTLIRTDLSISSIENFKEKNFNNEVNEHIRPLSKMTSNLTRTNLTTPKMIITESQKVTHTLSEVQNKTPKKAS